MSDSNSRRWLPLESNPEVINKFVSGLGLPADYSYVDVYGLDDDLLAMVPEPVLAVLLLFPITPKYEEHRHAEQAAIDAKGQHMSPNVYFMRQTIDNACGTIGILHSIANNSRRIPLGGYLKEFLEKTQPMTPAERGAHLEGVKEISVAHQESASEGQTEAPPLEADTNLHFICFADVDGHVYEFDGRKPFPINHGKRTSDSLLRDVAPVIQSFMRRDPDQVNFSMLALVKE
eukprot:Opistho-1_new@51921